MSNMAQGDMREYNNVLPRLLIAVPEIRENYEEMLRENNSAHLLWTEQDSIDMHEINQLHGLSETVQSSPGLTLVMENLLIPFLITLTANPSQANRLADIMAWIEELASNSDFQVRNLISVTVCEALLTTYASHFDRIFPYMGKHTQNLCRMQLTDYKVDAGIRNLLTSH